MQVINVRGTTGSGKTTVMRGFLEHHGRGEIITLSEGVKAHLLEKSIVIGRYKQDSKFGGVDAIAKIEYVIPAILKALEKRPTVLFEGLLVSHSFEKWREFSGALLKLQKEYHALQSGMLWAFIRPPFRVNRDRLRQRNNVESLRDAKGDQYLANFIQRYKSMLRIWKKARAAKQNTLNLDWQDPLKELIITARGIHENKLLPSSRQGLQGFLKPAKR